MEYTKEIFDKLKAETDPEQWQPETVHTENKLYINDDILYCYDNDGKTVKEEERHYILMNGLYLKNVPNKNDAKTSRMRPNNSFTRTEEERKALAKKGVEAREKARQERKTFKESLELFLNIEATATKTQKIAGRELYKTLPESVKKHITEQDLIVLSAIKQAQSGSYNHAVFIRDTVGEKPTDKQEITADIMTDADRSLIEKLHNRIEHAEK